MKKEEILKLLCEYYSDYELEMINKNHIINFINNNDIFLGKKNQCGHLTASAWVINKDKNKVLLTYHRKLEMWLQLGGHTADNEDILSAALREAIEESGLSSLKLISSKVFDIDVNRVPKYENEKEHFHFDIRFVFEANDSETVKISDESKDVKWVPFSNIASFNNDEAFKRMIMKTHNL